VGYDGFKHRKGTKIHVCVDRDSMPLSIIIGPGNEHDSKKLLELVGDLDWKPEQLYADAAYDTEHIRRGLESMGIEPNIPVNPRNGRRPRPYNVGLYRRMRSAVERFFGWIKSFRRTIIRYERPESTYKALVTIASITIHLRIRNLEMSSG
jgi:transposase